MTIREDLEQWEDGWLSPYAAHSNRSVGRLRQEPPCDIRPVFQRDRDRIIHSKSFRRLKDKTQVFLSPLGDHYRTRLTHTLEVSQTARTIARALRMNEELAEAISLGHDLGHTPFGHAGERALNRVCPQGFHHALQSVRTVDFLEKDGQGLNLTYEVRDGIRNHSVSRSPATLEGQIVRLSDKIAYTHHDMDDAILAGILTERDVPAWIREMAGGTSVERMDCFIHDVVTNSYGKDRICMSEPMEKALWALRDFMFERVYLNPEAEQEEKKAEKLMEMLYDYYLHHLDLLPAELAARRDLDCPERLVCDYLASMTDRFAIARYEELFVPKSWQ